MKAGILRSFGAVICRTDSPGSGPERRKYLLLRNVKGHWDFPKGLQEEGETSVQTVRREVQEETGIRRIRVARGFSRELKWYLSYRGRRTLKIARFVAATADGSAIRLSAEHSRSRWVSRTEAVTMLEFADARALVRAADRFFRRRDKRRGGKAR